VLLLAKVFFTENDLIQLTLILAILNSLIVTLSSSKQIICNSTSDIMLTQIVFI